MEMELIGRVALVVALFSFLAIFELVRPMYLVGVITRHRANEYPQWYTLSLRRTRRGAHKDCTTPSHFYIKLRFGMIPIDAKRVHPVTGARRVG